MVEEKLDEGLLAFVREMKDRQEIMDCLHRYTRGVDRFDRDLMLSAYHPDARDEHGAAEGVAADFCDWAIGWHGAAQTMHHHTITNVTIELEGDSAHVESYYLFCADNREGPPSLCFGRYVDRFEKREGRWAIAHRVCVNELIGLFIAPELDEEWRRALLSTGPGTRDKNDISYARPLVTGKIQA
jgi:ketosteroid isomerase-like protein